MKRLRAVAALWCLVGLIPPAHAAITSIFTLPSGADTQIQYNDGGYFGAEAAFTYNKTSNTLTVSSISATNLSISSISVTGTQSIGTVSITSGTIGTLFVTSGTITGFRSTASTMAVANITTATITSASITTATISTSLVLPGGSLSNPAITFGNLANGIFANTSSRIDFGFGAVNPFTCSSAGCGVELVPGTLAGGLAMNFVGDTGTGFFNVAAQHLLEFSNNTARTFEIATTSVTVVGSLFAGSSAVQLTNSTGNLLATSLTGTVPNASIDTASVTKQGNLFNSASQLVKLDTAGGFSLSATTSTNLSATTLQNAGVTNATLSSTGIKLLGNTSGSNYGTGNYGESISSVSSGGSAYVNGQWTNHLSITLTTGIWELSACTQQTTPGTQSGEVRLGMSTTSGNSATGLTIGDNRLTFLFATAGSDTAACIPGWVQTVSGSTVYYLKVWDDFSGGTPKYFGRISAVRIQ